MINLENCQRKMRSIILLLIATITTTWISACQPQSEPDLIDTVASLVAENHYDQALHGVDWKTIHKKYKALIKSSHSKSESILLMDQMLQELGDSHCGVGDLTDIERATSPYLFGEASVGLDLRLIEGEAVVTQVEDNSPADNAKMRPGHVLKSIDGIPVSDIIAKASLRPPFTDANRKFHQTRTLLWQLYGRPGTKVSIVFSDPEHTTTQLVLNRKRRTGGMRLFPNLPIAFLTREARALEGGIQYLGFNAFQPDNPTELISTLDSLDPNAPLIIDLRGNEGGSARATSQILSRFVQHRMPVYDRVGRDDTVTVYAEPAGLFHQGEVVVLTDEMSISAAENLAGIMQHARLATIVGSRTPGQLLWGEGFPVSETVMAVIPTARVVYPDGSEIEGRGLIPDIEVPLNRDELYRGIDKQLVTAVNFLKAENLK